VFVNVPPRAVVQVLRPDGSLVRSLPAAERGSLRWDLLSQSGAPVGGGLYRAVILGRDAGGRSAGTQTLNLGLVRQRVE
jgi:hypothetical protein